MEVQAPKLPKIISPQTLVPIGVIGTIIGGVFFITSIHFRTLENTANLLRIEERVEKLEEQNVINAERTTRIESKQDSMIVQLTVLNDNLQRLADQLRELEIVR